MKTLLYEGKYLSLFRRDDWEFAARPFSEHVVAVLPITDENEVVLVEQYRHPIQARGIEIPAGIYGDEPEHEGESFAAAAARELLEETGYRAGTMTELLVAPTSPGMTSEFTHFFLATDLVREHDGGGCGGEEIDVHLIPLAELRERLVDCRERGLAIDSKISSALWLAEPFLQKAAATP